MGFTLPMRIAAITIMTLLALGLGWRGFVIYEADKRAVLAASLAEASESGQASEEAGGVTPEPVTIKVHVEGAVQNPGLYTLAEGARVHDAIVAAGGALPEGVPGALNLAAPLADGTKIYVYTREELETGCAPKAFGASYAPAQPGAPAGAGYGAASGLVSINTASAAELEALPGIGPATAQKIIEYRTLHGPFRSVDDLIHVSGIGPKTLEKLRPYLRP